MDNHRRDEADESSTPGADHGSNSSNPNTSEPDATKLERRKLELEIQDLERAWWQRPAYLAAVIPSVLALGTLFIGYLTGYFQNQATLNEIRTRELTAQRQMLEGEVAVFEEQKKTLVEEKDTLTRQLETSTSALAAAETDRKELIQQKAALDADIAGLGREQVRLRTETIVAPLRSQLNTLERTIAREPRNTAAAALQEMFAVRDGNERIRIEFVRQWLERVIDGEARTAVLGALYLARLDSQWRDELLKYVRQALPAQFDAMRPVAVRWFGIPSVLLVIDWPSEDRDVVFDTLLALLESNAIAPPNQHSILGLMLEYELNRDAHSFTARPRTFLRIAKRLRDLALSPDMPHGSRIETVHVIRGWSPPLYVAVAAALLTQDLPRYTDKTDDPFDRERREQWLIDDLRRDLTDDFRFGKYQAALKYPSTIDKAHWDAWSQSVKSTFLDYWLEPDMTRLHNDNSVLQKLMLIGAK